MQFFSSIISIFAFIISLIVIIYILSVIPGRLKVIQRQIGQVYSLLESQRMESQQQSKIRNKEENSSKQN